jgi:transcriptional regulator with XRE-family HTH domain
MHLDTPDRLGPLLRYHRERAGLSRRALSALSAVSETAIYDAEHGKPTVQLQTLYALLDALNLSLHVDGPLVAEYERTLAPDDPHA